MKVSEHKIISFIRKENTWVDATTIAQAFGVSSRTIRNYMKQINMHHPNMIVSSYKGYMINQSINESAYQNIISDEHKERQLYIIRRLINTTMSISVYDLADELYISDSQFARVLNDVKQYLSSFHLQIERRRNRICIIGEEIDKRKLISHMINNETADGFLLSQRNDFLLMDEHSDELKNALQMVLEKNGLYANDYGFHTIFTHVLIMILRVRDNHVIRDVDQHMSENIQKEGNEYRAVSDLNEIIAALYHITLPPLDSYYLSLIIANNCLNRDMTSLRFDNLETFVDRTHIELARKILDNLKDNYGMDEFSTEFIINFTIHVSNLFSRLSHNMYTRNPLAKDFKEQYPLIYDMAAFVIKEINDYQPFTINDDEIAFIAFHIGSYLEKSTTMKQKLNVCFLYADYHNIYLNALEKIQKELHSHILISSVISVKEGYDIPPDTDLIISCAGGNTIFDIPLVEISVLVSQNDLHMIRKMVAQIEVEKKQQHIKDTLNSFIKEQLFKKDFYVDDAFDMIEALGKECIEMDLCAPDYIDSVIEREKISSTSFKNGVAIPHSLKATAKQSFLCIVSNSKPMQWQDNAVHIIVMIGISTHDRQKFKTIFDAVIQLLYEVDNVRKLMLCKDYASFIDMLLCLMKESGID